MTKAFITNRIDDLNRTIESLDQELSDPDSKGPDTANRKTAVRIAMRRIGTGIDMLSLARDSGEI